MRAGTTRPGARAYTTITHWQARPGLRPRLSLAGGAASLRSFTQQS